jgi:REP-associated tyrosine transposase
VERSLNVPVRMSRPLRPLRAGLVYHVMARGTGKMTIFLDDQDRCRFLSILRDVVQAYAVDVWLACLMGTHYHLGVRTRRPNLSDAMRQLNGRFSQWWNKRHAHVGHVLQARFKAQVVEEQGYFPRLCRYILLNPVAEGLVERPEEWRWSSYRATVGLDPLPPWLDVEGALRVVGVVTGATDRRTLQAHFAAFIAAVDGRPEEIARLVTSDARVIGSDRFRRRFATQARAASREVPRRERLLAEPPLEHVLRTAQGPVALRASILAAHDDYGYTQRQIACCLGVSKAAVGRVIVAARQRRPIDLRALRAIAAARRELTPSSGDTDRAST